MVLKRAAVPVIAFMAGIMPMKSAAQGWPPADSAVLAGLRRTAPCPSTPPRSWFRPDSLLPTTPRCHLVAAAAIAMQASTDTAFHRRSERAICVRVHAFAFETLPAAGTGQAYWTVEFLAADGSGVGAYIDRATGAVRLAHFPNEFGMSLDRRCGTGARPADAPP